jgi:hypothetical protein
MGKACQSVALGQDPDLAPVQPVLRRQISRDRWVAIHCQSDHSH